MRTEGRICRVEPPPGARCIAPGTSALATTPRSGCSAWSGRRCLSLTTTRERCGPRALSRRDRAADAEHGWQHGTDYVPHDAKVQGVGHGRTRVETMQRIGLKPMLVPTARSRTASTRCGGRCRCACSIRAARISGIAALEQYRREWDDDKKAFKQSDVEDWTSHPADAFPLPGAGLAAGAAARSRGAGKPGWVIPPPPEPAAE